jgi:late competence protein required for DNA uptake (superfamily II DNA/RNA helicase)
VAKSKKATFDEAPVIWQNYLKENGIVLTGPQEDAAKALVLAMSQSNDIVFWQGRATGKTFLIDHLSKCFGRS